MQPGALIQTCHQVHGGMCIGIPWAAHSNRVSGFCSVGVHLRLNRAFHSRAVAPTAMENNLTLTVDEANYGLQLERKVARVKSMFETFKLPPLEIFPSPPKHYRQRTEFAVRHEGDDMFFAMHVPNPPHKRSKQVRIDTFPVASLLINELMPVLLAELKKQDILKHKLFQTNFHTTLSGDALVTLLYHKQLDEQWKAAAGVLRTTLATQVPSLQGRIPTILGRSLKQKVELDSSYVVEHFSVNGREYVYKQVEGAFSQPNGAVCQSMLSWAQRVTRPGASAATEDPAAVQDDLLELYCGNGNFTIPLAQNFRRVVATEVSKTSVAAARDNIVSNGAANIFMARMSSEEFTAAWRERADKRRLVEMGGWDSLNLRTLLVDPPRAGLDAATCKLMSEFPRVVYISCNPETLRENLETVRDSHDVAAFAVFDQFPYTDHLECGAYLVQKP